MCQECLPEFGVGAGEPQPEHHMGHGRTRLWSELADVLLAVVLFALHVGVLQAFEKGASAAPAPPVWCYLLLAPACVAVAIRQRLPKTAFVVVLVVAAGSAFVPYPTYITDPIAWIAVYTVGSRCAIGWVISAVVAYSGILLFEMIRAPFSIPVPDMLLVVLTPAVFAVLGCVVRRSQRRAVELELTLDRLREAEQRLASEAVLIERARIARELHDIVAHGLSLIALRAGVAKMLLPDDQTDAKQAVEIIEKAARESSAEMRHLLGALRGAADESETPEADSQPGLDRLDDLVSAARSSGLPVNVIREGVPRHLPRGQELAAYRIVQEALTNVLKHAGTAPVTVVLQYRADRLVVDVVNEAPPDRAELVDAVVSLPTQGHGGHGLIGMRERVALYGGTLRTDPLRGGFRVTAEIPIGAT